MSVRVTDTSGPLWSIVDEDGGHTGQVDPSTVTHGVNDDGTENRDIVVVPCPEPGCGSVSYWPASALPGVAERLNA